MKFGTLNCSMSVMSYTVLVDSIMHGFVSCCRAINLATVHWGTTYISGTCHEETQAHYVDRSWNPPTIFSVYVQHWLGTNKADRYLEGLNQVGNALAV
jgi:hypothetical protein